ncbi:hypothetical protein [Streptomyces sp. NRRL S-1824]|uniref:hypothetical protein n=1 Tax=Streptomyces sp. NRRL S-1824 TaxID=1463889 RepID=UPI0007C4E507|nr:hypothetical protein [Streptomyces sp. NRRL S-1824]
MVEMTTEVELVDHVVAERQALIEQWAERHGVDAARRLAEAQDLADAVAAEITPDNTLDTYNKSWRVRSRFCTATDLPELEGNRGSLVAFVTWMLREGQHNGRGYAPVLPVPTWRPRSSVCASAGSTSAVTSRARPARRSRA